MPRLRRTPVLMTLFGAAALLAGVVVADKLLPRASTPPDVPGLLWPDPRPLAPFALEDQHGVPFGVERLRDRWTFLFFGYTHCPDVCPSTLALLGGVARALRSPPSGGAAPQFAFVSVDPARDTREHLARYLAFFDPAFLGLRGDAAALGALAGQLGIAYGRAPPAADGAYAVDHSAAILLTDPAGRLIAVFTAPHDAAAIAADFRAIRRFVEG